MMYLLPAPKKTGPKTLLQTIFKILPFKRIPKKKVKYGLAALIDLVLIVLILIVGSQPAKELVSPLATSFQNIYSKVSHKYTDESFAFMPGQAPNKFDDVELNNLTYLSFFDVPLTETGEINKGSRGYGSFTSDSALTLFERARSSNTKILLTLSAFDEDRISYVLNHKSVQERLADQIVEEINDSNISGVTIDFELPDNKGSQYQSKFNDFMAFLNQKVSSQNPSAIIAVAVPAAASKKEGLYNIDTLSKSSDKVFLIASDFIVPEVNNSAPTNPKFGYNTKEYFENLSNLLGSFLSKVKMDKLVMERAWYGNGDNYPLYVPLTASPDEETKEPASVFVDQDKVERLASGVPAKGREAAKRNIPLIAKALDAEGILDSNVLAYALATIEHETDETFEPLEEIQGRVSARRLGYEGGMNYFGRGFIQLTHLRNYRNVGERIGMGDKLAKNPELAADPEIAAKILAAFFKDNNVANLASQGRYVAARRPVNPDRNAYSVATLALKYESNE